MNSEMGLRLRRHRAPGALVASQPELGLHLSAGGDRFVEAEIGERVGARVPDAEFGPARAVLGERDDGLGEELTPAVQGAVEAAVQSVRDTLRSWAR